MLNYISGSSWGPRVSSVAFITRLRTHVKKERDGSFFQRLHEAEGEKSLLHFGTTGLRWILFKRLFCRWVVEPWEAPCGGKHSDPFFSKKKRMKDTLLT